MYVWISFGTTWYSNRFHHFTVSARSFAHLPTMVSSFSIQKCWNTSQKQQMLAILSPVIFCPWLIFDTVFNFDRARFIVLFLSAAWAKATLSKLKRSTWMRWMSSKTRPKVSWNEMLMNTRNEIGKTERKENKIDFNVLRAMSTRFRLVKCIELHVHLMCTFIREIHIIRIEKKKTGAEEKSVEEEDKRTGIIIQRRMYTRTLAETDCRRKSLCVIDAIESSSVWKLYVSFWQVWSKNSRYVFHAMIPSTISASRRRWKRWLHLKHFTFATENSWLFSDSICVFACLPLPCMSPVMSVTQVTWMRMRLREYKCFHWRCLCRCRRC